MAFQPVLNTAKVTIRCVGGNGTNLADCRSSISWYVNNDVGNWTPTTLTQLADYADDWWNVGKNAGSPAKSLVSTQWVAIDAIAKDLEVINGASSVVLMNDPGTRGGDPVSPSCPVVIKILGDPGNLPTQGRHFFAAGVEADLVGEDFGGGFVTDCVQVFVDFLTDLNDIAAGGDPAWAQVIVSRHLGTHTWGTDPDDPPLPKLPNKRATAVTNTISSHTFREVVGSQRKRRSVG